MQFMLLGAGWWRCSDFTLKIPSDIFTSMGIPFNSIGIVFSMLLFLYLQCSAGKDALILFQIQPLVRCCLHHQRLLKKLLFQVIMISNDKGVVIDLLKQEVVDIYAIKFGGCFALLQYRPKSALISQCIRSKRSKEEHSSGIFANLLTIGGQRQGIVPVCVT